MIFVNYLQFLKCVAERIKFEMIIFCFGVAVRDVERGGNWLLIRKEMTNNQMEFNHALVKNILFF